MNVDDAVNLSVIVTGIATVATAIVAMSSLTGSRQDSRERTRPVVVATLRRELLSHGALNLVLHNYGASPAFDLSVAFEPPMPPGGSLPDADDRKWIALRYARPYPLLAPNMTLSNVYRTIGSEQPPITVKLTYGASDGRRYHAHFYLDPDPLLKESQATTTHSDKDQGLIKALQAIVRAVDRP